MIGITLGDVTGIGPEITLKALAAEASADDARYLIIGDQATLDRLNNGLGINLPLTPFPHPTSRFQVFSLHGKSLPPDLTPGSPLASEAAVDWLTEAAQRCLQGQLDAVVTAPVSKESIIRSGIPFIGQTEFLSQIAGTNRTVMMLLGEDDRGRWLRVALATTHVRIKLLSDQITQAKVELAIEMAAQACRDLGLPQARVGVCGLNPHAGEGGEMGDEEIKVIAPAIEAQRQRGYDANGPLAADTLFHQAYQGNYDAVVAMFHDQGLPPLKMVAFNSGVNWTLGLPFIRTSPDHGTAYNIAGQNKANPSSMRAALRLAKQLVRNKSR